MTIGFLSNVLLTCHGCSYTDDRSKLDDLGVEFLTDPANAHLFPVLEDPEIPEPEPEPTPQPEPETEPATQPKPAKKRKSVAKAGGGDAAIARKKKKEPELV